MILSINISHQCQDKAAAQVVWEKAVLAMKDFKSVIVTAHTSEEIGREVKPDEPKDNPEP